MAHTYREFVKEQFKLKPPGVKSSQWMKEIGKRWKQRTNKVGGGFIPARDGIYLLLSDEAYLYPNKRKSVITASGETFQYDKSLSSLITAVYHSPTRLIIAYRGTALYPQLGWAQDVAADLRIVEGTFSKSTRAQQALQAAQRAQKKYPQLIMSCTGHSLGGACAQYVGYHSDFKNSKVVAFNTGSAPKPQYREYPKCNMNDNSDYCQKQRNQILYHVPGDVISEGQIDVSTIVSQEPNTNVHSLKNFKIAES
jgi:hypothetical protein